MQQAEIHKIAFIGDYLPRRCGIATFTSDLCRAVAAQYPEKQCFAVPVNDLEEGYDYPPEVRFEIQEQDLLSYQRAADFLNISNVDVVSVQHEFGIYGGPAGGHLLALLRSLKMPIVTTLHTILLSPNSDQRRVMQDLIELSTRLVVMTQRSLRILVEAYNVPASKIDIIPHGIPDIPFVDPNYYKDHFGVEGRYVFLTFGLLSPNKGVEHVLNALPEVVKAFPNVVYIVLGATHPKLVHEHGETYRMGLERLARANGVQKNVIFYNRFVDIEELKEFIGAADVYITPYLNEAQIVSGTLAYTFGAGKAVISTPYWHAVELLDNERGVIVPFGDSEAIARETMALLRDEVKRHALRKNAYKLGREMIWSSVAQLYLASFERGRMERGELSRKIVDVKTLDQQPEQLPELKLDHLFRMTDSTGILQHATFTIPNFSHGYCTDDNARALILTSMLEELGYHSSRIRSLSSTYAAFLQHAFNTETGRFRNFLGYNHEWCEDAGSEDCHGRALWALGTYVGRSRLPAFRIFAAQLFEQALPCVRDLTSPRAWAFTLVGIHEYLRRLEGDRLVTQMREELTERLVGHFKATARPDWLWFEERMTYANAKLPHALIVNGKWSGQIEVTELGLKTLAWLMEVQTTESGYFRPIGTSGFFQRGQPRADYDQQPIEAQAMVSACISAFRATADSSWHEKARQAMDWFLGRNDLGLPIYDSTTGGCRDGLHVDRLNQNQGAESTLAYLMSLAEMQLLQNEVSVFKEPMSA